MDASLSVSEDASDHERHAVLGLLVLAGAGKYVAAADDDEHSCSKYVAAPAR